MSVTRIHYDRAQRLADRLADRRIALDVTDAGKDWLAITGYDPAYGARPLRRLVQREIGDRLAKALLSGDVRDGDTVEVDVEGGGFGLDLDDPGSVRRTGLVVRRAETPVTAV